MRKVGNYIPYMVDNHQVYVYIQKRDLDAPVRPGLFGLFGGGLKENENSIKALTREAEEEMNYTPQELLYLGKYQDEVNTEKEVYYEKVDKNFPAQVRISEGMYGVFVNRSMIEEAKDISPSEKKILFDLIEKVK